MLSVLHSDTSPYVALWYLFIIFFGCVLVFQIICLAVKAYFTWRVRVLRKRYTKGAVQ